VEQSAKGTSPTLQTGNRICEGGDGNPKVRAVYEKMAAKEHKRPYALALSDYFKGKDLISKK